MTYLAGEQNVSPQARDYLAKIDTSSKFLLSLINDILDMSKAESNRMELKPEPYPKEEFETYVDAVIRPLIVERKQTLDFSVSLPNDLVPLMEAGADIVIVGGGINHAADPVAAAKALYEKIHG